DDRSRRDADERAAAQGRRRRRRHAAVPGGDLLMRIHSVEAIPVSYPEANFATKAIIEGMADNLVGKDPTHVEALWRQNKDQAWWYGYGGGIASYAVAAIDIALWDLKGKALEASVLDLLGGPVHERLPAIASCHAH